MAATWSDSGLSLADKGSQAESEPDAARVSDALESTIEHSRFGWDNILLPLLSFAFSLTDLALPPSVGKLTGSLSLVSIG